MEGGQAVSDTPRTDRARLDEHDPAVAVASECSKLERELTATNARYNSLQLQCYEQRKEINRLNEHVTELENRLRALWDKLEYERKHYMEQIRRLEEAGDALANNHNPFTFNDWRKAKEAKP
jgi:predicted  nucleic acid-binding Zn-ribbon protein